MMRQVSFTYIIACTAGAYLHVGALVRPLSGLPSDAVPTVPTSKALIQCGFAVREVWTTGPIGPSLSRYTPARKIKQQQQQQQQQQEAC